MGEETKTCKRCGEEKELNETNFIWKDTFWLGKCRECINLERREQRAKRRGNEYKPRYTSDYKIERDIIMLNQEEIKIVKLLTSRYNEILEILDNKIVFEKDDNDRTKKTVLINKNLHEIIEKKQKETNLNYSDVLNLILKKGVEYI